MRFVLPLSAMKNMDAERLHAIFELTEKNKFPGFLNPNIVQANQSLSGQMKHPPSEETVKMLIDKPFVHLPYAVPKSYIMNRRNQVLGFVLRKTLITYWFEFPLNLEEIYEGEQREIPVLIEYVSLGAGKPCHICNGYGAVDWVDGIKLSEQYYTPPKNRYILASNKELMFMIDNAWVNSFDNEKEFFIQACPLCLGLGCDCVLVVDGNDKIEAIYLESEDERYDGLKIYTSRETLVDCGPFHVFPNKYKW